MSLFKELYVKLPAKVQDQIFERMVKTGRVFEMPVFKMLLHSFRFFGGDLGELRQAFTAPANRSKSLVDICRELGNRTCSHAAEKEHQGNLGEAKELYHRAAVYFLLGDWYTYDLAEIDKNYNLMRPCYDKFRQLCSPPVEKVELHFEIGSIYGYYRLPSNGRGPFPAIVMLQGNDEVKEFNYRFENMALGRGVATLNIDPPGWGESGLSGNRFSSAEVYRKAMKLVVDFLQSKEEILPDAIGVFGVSFGGLLAPFAAGLESRFAAVACIGGPIIDINRVRRNIPAAQANRAYIYTGTKNLKELMAWTDRIDFRGVVSQVECPVLVVHGEKDELLNPAHAREIANLVKGKKDLRIVPNGDHMCTHALESDVGPYIFSWLARALAQTHKSIH
jgi:cephalosporin-C deacetylase-like acetyl esterase